jgi:hypothetical protein
MAPRTERPFLLVGDKAQLLEGGYAVIETDLLGDQAVLDFDDSERD